MKKILAIVAMLVMATGCVHAGRTHGVHISQRDAYILYDGHYRFDRSRDRSRDYKPYRPWKTHSDYRYGANYHRDDNRYLQRDRKAGIGRVDRRQHHQAREIRQAWRGGELTAAEYRKLKKRQQRIHKLEEKFLRDDRLSKKERRKLEKLQDKAEKQISNLADNDRRRGRYLWRR